MGVVASPATERGCGPPMKDADNANEADVRAEIADPLIKLLGYERGTANDVARVSAQD